MSIRRLHHFAFLVALPILCLVGCGPTHTAGTSGMSVKDLAVLSISQLPKESPVKIHSIQFDGAGEAYGIGGSREFYLLPRDHTASFTLTAEVPDELGGLGKIIGLFAPQGSMNLPGPQNIPLGTFAAGKTYELAVPTEGFDKLLTSGEISLVREKRK